MLPKQIKWNRRSGYSENWQKRIFGDCKVAKIIDIEADCREGVRVQLDCMKELCKERNNLYEKQNDLKGQKQKIEKALEA